MADKIFPCGVGVDEDVLEVAEVDKQTIYSPYWFDYVEDDENE